jgi:glycosyltransferase involved in cell wall biosynthesis
VPDVASALARKEGEGTFGIVTVPAWSFWAFSPQILWRFNSLIRSADFVSLHSLYCFPILAGHLLAHVHSKPYGLWPHGVLAPFQRSVSARKKKIYDWLFSRRILDNASVLFYSAKGEHTETEELHLRPPFVIVPHGFESEAFASLPPRGRFRRRFLGGHTGPVILFLARVNAKKGLDLLAKAMARVVSRRKDVLLAIVGPADPRSFESRVRGWIRESGVESQTVLTGVVDAPTRLEALADADVFVLPSHAENFGFSIFEAMASRLPEVVSETVNYAGDIRNGNAGLTVPLDPERIADGILQLLDDSSLRNHMGENGVKLAKSYSWDINGDRVEQTVASILCNRPLPAELSLDIASKS